MTTPSVLSSNGLSIAIHRPIVLGGSYICDYTDEVNEYSHVISTIGGYISAEFSISGNEILANDWLQSGLGRHIIVYGSSMQKIWDGFVNQVNVPMGGVNFSRGPLTNIANRVSAMYTPVIDDTVDPPITGVTTETLITEDLDSQAKYGIWEKVLNVGTVTLLVAEYIRNLYLVENANPEASNTISIGQSSNNISVSIQCRGYIDWLSYVYNNNCSEPVTVLYVIVSDKIISILDADPNNIFDTLHDGIDENLVIQSDSECENKLAKTVIENIISLGGGTDDRWMFGIYANRKPVYQAMPTTVEYLYHGTSTEQEIETVSGEKIRPWDVLPGKWVATPDFLSSSGIKIAYPREDPRVFFAEEISYTAPDKVTINGAKIRKLSQYLAKLGLGGV